MTNSDNKQMNHVIPQPKFAKNISGTYQTSNSALDKSSELQKRFNRADISSPQEASVGSGGHANKSFQFTHQTALLSCSSGGDSSNPPQGSRHRSQSGKNGVKQIAIAGIQNVHPVGVVSSTTTNANAYNNNLDNSYGRTKQTGMPQSTQNQKSGKKFTFTLNPKDA